jgi:hypothetical protein
MVQPGGSTNLGSTDAAVVEALRHALHGRIEPSQCTLESAARIWTDVVDASLGSALILARVFAVVPAAALPTPDLAFARAVAAQAGHALEQDAPVLALMATRGVCPAWNDRQGSRDHRAVPLASPDYVASMPMVSWLLGELRAELRPRHDGHAIWVSGTGTTATFYVFDARTSVDARGRLTIPAREFVREHDVRTVLGVGGTVRGGMLFTMILFARQHVTRSVADRLVPVAADFASLVQDAVSGGRLFEPATRS